MFKALSNPHRLEIFVRLADCCPNGAMPIADSEATRFVGQLGEDLGIAPSTVSHHVKELRQAGLITVERRGKNIECRLNVDVVRTLAAVLEGRIPDS